MALLKEKLTKSKTMLSKTEIMGNYHSHSESNAFEISTSAFSTVL